MLALRSIRALRRVAAIALLAAGCSGQRPPAPPPAAQAQAPARRTAPPKLVPDLVIDLPASAPAPWLDLAPAPRFDALGADTIEARGEHAALIRTQGGRYVVHDRDGAAGPIDAPDGAVWVGIGLGDRVLAATPAGELVAATPAAAAAGEFQSVVTLPGARVWDVAGDVIAAGTSWDEISVSTNRGKTFRKGSVGSEREITSLFARSDGVVVARARWIVDGTTGKETTFVSHGGGPWKESRFQPEKLDKTGAWIWIGADCPTVLSSDGSRWVHADVYALATRDAWSRPLWRTYEAVGFAAVPRTSAFAPPPPAPRGPEVRGSDPCVPPPPAEPEVPATAPIDLAPAPIAVTCRDLECLRDAPAPSPPLSPSTLSLLSDGLCAVDRADPDTGACPASTPLSRAPHAMRRGSPVVIDLPAGCDAVRALTARGLELLVCRDGADHSAIYALEGERTWHREADLDVAPGDIGNVTVADDGTALLLTPCPAGAPCRAFARQPLALGEPSAWRAIAIEGALAYRAGPGGAVIAATSSPAGQLSFVIDLPQRSPRALAIGGQLPFIADFALTATGRIAVWTQDGPHRIEYAVGEDLRLRMAGRKTR